MTVIDILFRVDSICKKYQRYDVEKKRELNAHVEDAFGLLYAFMKAEIDAAVQKFAVRRTKARLMEEVPKLQKLAQKRTGFMFSDFKCSEDQGLDFISEGLDTLKNLAQDMNEEIDWQVPPIDEMDTKEYCGAFIGGQGNI